jgi:hypothetical protein
MSDRKCVLDRGTGEPLLQIFDSGITETGDTKRRAARRRTGGQLQSEAFGGVRWRGNVYASTDARCAPGVR